MCSLETDTPIFDQQPEKEVSDSLSELFKKPYEKPAKRGTKDKLLEEIKNGREERLTALKEMRQSESNDPIQIFSKVWLLRL